MGLLAKAPLPVLEKAWAELDPRPGYRLLRPPETGMIMARGRAGGSGAPFNLGEIPVSRCTIETEDGQVGTAYVMGREHRHAELAAVFDAMMQDVRTAPALRERVIEPLEREDLARRKAEREKTARTRVAFFTMVRGE
jgi:alpha-D-ribose 1-methylphosphonate 5-triphosphate synthase subunit PhnG